MSDVEALIALIDAPPEDGYVRAHRLTQDGDPDRMVDVWPELAKAYVSHCLADHQHDDIFL